MSICRRKLERQISTLQCAEINVFYKKVTLLVIKYTCKINYYGMRNLLINNKLVGEDSRTYSKVEM